MVPTARKHGPVILILAAFAIIICAIAYFLLKADRVASERAAVYALASAVIFLAGALTHQQFSHRVATESTRDVATQPADGAPPQGVVPTTGTKSLGALDAADVDQQKMLHVRGWALGANGEPPSQVTAIVDGTMRVDISKSSNRPRPDVAASLKQPGAKNSGYDGVVPVADLKPGEHQVSISVVASDRTTVSFPAHSSLTFVTR